VKYLTFALPEDPHTPRLGALLGENVIDFQTVQSWAQEARRLPPEALPGSLSELLVAGPQAWVYTRNLVNILEGEDPLVLAGAGRTVGRPLSRVLLFPPLPRPMSLRDFYAFETHVSTAFANRDKEVPPEWYRFPVFYFSNPNSVFGHGETIPYPAYTRAMDYELETACVIGRPGRNIHPDDAEEFIFGYLIFNDWSARDVQREEMKVGLGPAKGKDFASSLGPWIVTQDELGDRSAGRPGVFDLQMVARVNGQERSRGNWKDLHYSFGDLLARASEEVWLLPGDVIGSGTVGSGCLLELTRGLGPWLQPGDWVELEIERIGVLANRVGTPAGFT
jgi:fumarylacetoacetate (FAA) hydrolase